MGTIAFATENPEARERLRSVIGPVSDIELVITGTDEASIQEALTSHNVRALCVEPMTFDQWLMMRKLLKNQSSESPQPRLVLLCSEPDAWYVYLVMAHGVSDVVDFRLPDQELETAIQVVIEGTDRVCSGLIDPQVDVVPVISDVGIVYADDIDRRIVSLVAAGYTDREIALIVNYSYQSVRNRISRILFNSGIRNRTQLAVQRFFEHLEERPKDTGAGWLATT